MEQNIDKLLTLSPVERIVDLTETDIEPKLLRAMVCALSDDDKKTLREQKIFAADNILNSLKWEQWQVEHQRDIQPQPQYRPVDVLLREFLDPNSGKKQAARKELQKRLAYLTALEQKRIIYAFLDTEVKTDRVFVLKYLDEHYDQQYAKAVETVWQLYHDFEAARLITHWFEQDFIIAHQDELAQDYRYFTVRLRLPADFPIDRSRLEMHELIHLAARRHLPLTEREAYTILTWTIYTRLYMQIDFRRCKSLFDLPFVSAIVWALGHLHLDNLLNRFYSINEQTKPLFASNEDPEKVKLEVMRFMKDHDFELSHDNIGTKECYEREPYQNKHI